jgi:hypothetical protein
MKTKNYLIPSFLVLSFLSFGLFSASVTPVQAAGVKKVTVAKSSVTWAASGKSELYKIKNSTVRAAYKTKVEKYAIRKKIKTITSAVVKGMHE